MSRRRTTPPAWPAVDGSRVELRPGTHLVAGRYRVHGEAGRGGMATVYRAHDRHLERPVALKVMHVELAGRRARELRFEREVGITRELPVHPGLVRLLDAGRLPELEQRPFSCLEWIDGPTLAFRLGASLRQPAARVVSWGRALAGALAQIHARGVVHRDLTARNVMLRRGSRPVVVDFGMAVRIEATTPRLTRLHERPGTVTAMAPEQYRGEAPTPAMDVYALGRLLYQLLTGEDPHATVPRSELLAIHREGRRVAGPLAPRSDCGPEPLRRVVDACLEPEPSGRPSMVELGASLQEIAVTLERGATVLRFPAITREVAPRRSSPLPTRPVGSRRRGSVRSAGSVLVLLALLLRHGGDERPEPLPWVTSEPTRAALRWPDVLVPYSWPIVIASPEVEPTPSTPVRRRVASRPRPVRTETVPSLDCESRRAQARLATEQWAWPRVLEATAEPRCWSRPGDRLRLRLPALVGLGRFDACVTEGRSARDPGLRRLVERCRRRGTAMAGGRP